MSNTPGAQARASTHAGRNRPSDVDELRDNIADIAGGVGDMASRQYEQAYDIATDAVEETGQIIRRNPLVSIGVGLGVGFLLGLIQPDDTLSSFPLLSEIPMAKEPKTLDELFHDTLKDIYFAEKKILATLPKMAKAAQNGELKAAFEKHRDETDGQVERPDQVFAIIHK